MPGDISRIYVIDWKKIRDKYEQVTIFVNSTGLSVMTIIWNRFVHVQSSQYKVICFEMLLDKIS